ncbi:MFS transporter [Arsenicicoccus dermatophilus]|uniref:MFS transporter n=1 Tax=Arsenicicoccus dermatophilus TaxID=1076331 RepID=UPI001F4C9830|nr:MFS transporter [Arsenicicoccus dermatophilus]
MPDGGSRPGGATSYTSSPTYRPDVDPAGSYSPDTSSAPSSYRRSTGTFESPSDYDSPASYEPPARHTSPRGSYDAPADYDGPTSGGSPTSYAGPAEYTSRHASQELPRSYETPASYERPAYESSRTYESPASYDPRPSPTSPTAFTSPTDYTSPTAFTSPTDYTSPTAFSPPAGYPSARRESYDAPTSYESPSYGGSSSYDAPSYGSSIDDRSFSPAPDAGPPAEDRYPGAHTELFTPVLDRSRYDEDDPYDEDDDLYDEDDEDYLPEQGADPAAGSTSWTRGAHGSTVHHDRSSSWTPDRSYPDRGAAAVDEEPRTEIFRPVYDDLHDDEDDDYPLDAPRTEIFRPVYDDDYRPGSRDDGPRTEHFRPVYDDPDDLHDDEDDDYPLDAPRTEIFRPVYDDDYRPGSRDDGPRTEVFRPVYDDPEDQDYRLDEPDDGPRTEHFRPVFDDEDDELDDRVPSRPGRPARRGAPPTRQSTQTRTRAEMRRTSETTGPTSRVGRSREDQEPTGPLTRAETRRTTGSHTRVAPRDQGGYVPREKPPVGQLLLMAAAGFITMMTEALPVAVTPSMRAGLGWTDGIIGQLVTAYAVGCGLAAIPMTALTRSVNRKTLLLTTLLAFVVTNSVPLVSSDLMILTVARFAAGACAGLLWAMLAGYATRLVVPGIAGRAMAIAMAGTPMALALGIPFGSLLGSMLGWRLSFAAVSALAALVLLLAIASLPRIPGEPRGGERPGLGSVLTLPGLGRVLAVTAFYSTAHNVVYTFLPALTQGRKDLRLDVLLLAFGLVAVIGLALVGKHVDRHLQLLATLVCAGLVACLAACFLVPAGPLFAVLGVVAVWGMAFGGAPTIFQTASARICGQSQEIGQALVVTTWNLCVAVAGALGGVLVDAGQTQTLPWVGTALALVATLSSFRLAAARARSHAVPRHGRAH